MQGEPLSSVSGGCFQQHSAILAREARRVRLLSFHHVLTAAHFMDYCLPPTAAGTSADPEPAHRPQALATAVATAHRLLGINRNCAALMWRLCSMTKAQSVKSLGVNWMRMVGFFIAALNNKHEYLLVWLCCVRCLTCLFSEKSLCVCYVLNIVMLNISFQQSLFLVVCKS